MHTEHTSPKDNSHSCTGEGNRDPIENIGDANRSNVRRLEMCTSHILPIVGKDIGLTGKLSRLC